MITQESGTASKRTPHFHEAYWRLRRMETERPGIIIVSHDPFVEVRPAEHRIICHRNRFVGLGKLPVAKGLHILNAEIESVRDAVMYGWYRPNDLREVEDWSIAAFALIERSSKECSKLIM